MLLTECGSQLEETFNESQKQRGGLLQSIL
jgi:hypothetical protein